MGVDDNEEALFRCQVLEIIQNTNRQLTVDFDNNGDYNGRKGVNSPNNRL